MIPEEVERQNDTLALISGEIAALLDRQSGALDKIDNKAAAMIGYALAAATFLATRHAQPALAVIAYVAFAAAVASGITAMAVRKYQDLNPRSLLQYAGWSAAQTRAKLTANQVHTFESNKERQDKKARWWQISLIALVFGTLLMVAGILVQTYGHDHLGAGRPAAPVHSGGHHSQPSSPAATASP
jgi:Ca2+/Na+ antiporter